MEAFEIDFQNHRASQYEIQRVPAVEEAIGRITPPTFVWWDGMADEIREMRRLAREQHLDDRGMQRLRELAQRALELLPEEARFAVEHQLVPKHEGARGRGAIGQRGVLGPDATPKQLREAEYGPLIRPTTKDMDLAVKLLVERKTTPLDRAVLAIARRVGSIGVGWEESLSDWLFLEQRLQELFEGKGVLNAWHESRVKVLLVPDKGGKPRLTLQPLNLKEALMLHAARMIATGITAQVCEQCQNTFMVGGGKQKRTDARFCSDKCRWDFNNERRRKA